LRESDIRLLRLRVSRFARNDSRSLNAMNINLIFEL